MEQTREQLEQQLQKTEDALRAQLDRVHELAKTERDHLIVQKAFDTTIGLMAQKCALMTALLQKDAKAYPGDAYTQQEQRIRERYTKDAALLAVTLDRIRDEQHVS